MNSKLTHRLLPLSEAGVAEAGDCLEAQRGLFCLPAVVNIGVQKAGTGELQTWLGAHPLMLAHGGEVHFFDGLRPSAAMLRCGQRQRTNLRQRYARHLWHRRPLSRDNVGAAASSAMAAGAPLVRPPRDRTTLPPGVLADAPPRPDGVSPGSSPPASFEPLLLRRLAYEKTPAYFDLSNPALLACAVPRAELLVMLRAPAARAISAYQMCAGHIHGKWCQASIDEAIGSALTRSASGSVPRLRRRHLSPQLKRLLTMGMYSAHLHRWLEHFDAAQMRILWLEHFKSEPFECMDAVQRFLGLPPHDYRASATRNEKGLWVIGKSKSSSERWDKTPPSPEVNATLHQFYAPWQRTLAELLRAHNLSLLPARPIPG